MSRESNESENTRDRSVGHAVALPPQVMPSDRQYAREFVGALIRLAQRDLKLLTDPVHASNRRMAAAEVAEFGAAQADQALGFAREATDAPRVDARVFGTIRRQARAASDASSIGKSYMTEAKTASSTSYEIMATLGALQVALRRKMAPPEALRVILKLEKMLDEEPAQTRELWSLLAEDVYVMAGDPVKAALLRRDRFASWMSQEPDAYDAHATLALETAALAQLAGSTDDDVMSWLDVSFQASPSSSGARPLLRKAWREDQLAYVAKIYRSLADSSTEADVVSSALYALGMLCAYRLNDSAQGLQALNEALASGASAGVAAIAFIALARASGESVVPDEFAGALSQRVECAASAMERADLLTQMAERFDADLALADSAVELAQSALAEYPGWTPALRLLANIHARDGRWERLIALHEQQLEVEFDPDERRRLHERIAEVAHDHLRDVAVAEAHLRAALEHGWKSPSSRRLLEIYRDTGRFQELVEHLLVCARFAPIRSEKLRFYEEAAVVSEARLHDVDGAIAIWHESLTADPSFITALASLERLYQGLLRWEELLALYTHELSLTPEDEIAARTALMCRCGEVAWRRLANSSQAEVWYERALSLDPICDDALRGQGMLFKEQGRWEDLIAMTERELERSGTPERRARCLRLIGETFTRQLNYLPGAAHAYRRLGQLGSEWHEEALIWLERVYEAQRDDEKRISVLRGRRKIVQAESDPRVKTWVARLSFRIGEVLEWSQRRPDLAMSEYLLALDEPTLVNEVLAALDRCLSVSSLAGEARAAVVDGLRERLDGMDPAACRVALEILASEARRAGDSEEEHQILASMTAIWLADPAVVEPAALHALASNDYASAEALRERRIAASVERRMREQAPWDISLTSVLRETWRQMDGENRIDESLVLTYLDHPLAVWLARDAGLSMGFDGAVDRERLTLIQRANISLGELVSEDSSWIARNLSVMAARAMHDRRRLMESLEFLCRSAEEPALEMQLWLDASMESLVDAETRRRWLRQAASLGLYEHPLREEIYRAMHTSNDTEGLVTALVDHVYSGSVEGDALASLALRAAHGWEKLSRPKDAIEILRVATINAPSNGEIAFEKARIELDMNDLDAARHSLEEAISSGCADDRRFDVLFQLGGLHLRDGGDRERAILLLEEAYTQHGQRREVGLKLAQAHLSYGRPERSVELLERVLPTPIVEEDLRHWVALGRALVERLNQDERGEQVLWSVFHAWPERNDALQVLHELAQRKKRMAIYTTHLDETLRTHTTITAPRRASLWMELGRVFLEEERLFEEAEHAYAEALNAGAPAGEALRMRAEAVSLQKSRQSVAAGLRVEAIAARDFSLSNIVDIAEKLDVDYASTQDNGRSRTIRQLRRSLGVNVPELGPSPRRVPQETVHAEQLWRLLDPEGTFAHERAVLVEFAPLVARIVRQEKPRFETERYNPDSYTLFHNNYLAIQRCFGFESLKFTLAPAVRGPVWTDALNFALPPSRIADDAPWSSRFIAAWVGSLAFAELYPYAMLTDAKVRDIIAAVAAKMELPHVGDSSVYMSEVSGGIASSFTPTARFVKRAEAALRAYPEMAQLSGVGRIDRILGLADRVAAAFTDHAGESVRELLRGMGARVSDSEPIDVALLEGNERVRSLLVYMLSDSYRPLRELVGVGARGFDIA